MEKESELRYNTKMRIWAIAVDDYEYSEKQTKKINLVAEKTCVLIYSNSVQGHKMIANEIVFGLSKKHPFRAFSQPDKIAQFRI